MPKIVNPLELAVAAERAWRVLGDLTDAASWIPGVVSAQMHGDVRVCTTVDGAEIRERITNFSPEGMSYRYEHLVTPAPVRDSRGTLRMRRRGAGCRVEWTAEFEPADPARGAEIVAVMTGAFQTAAQSLRRRIEGAPRSS